MAARLARAWLDTGRFPGEILALPRGERAFLWASFEVRDEENRTAAEKVEAERQRREEERKTKSPKTGKRFRKR